MINPSPILTAAELMSTPDHIIAWLRTLPPGQVVTRDMGDCEACLGANFLRAQGYPDAIWLITMGSAEGKGIGCPMSVWSPLYDLMMLRNPITAAQALEAFGVRV